MLSYFRKWIQTVREGAVDWDELEATLIQCDLSPALTEEIISRLRRKTLTAVTLPTAVEEELISLWQDSRPLPVVPAGGFVVWLIIGVNGVGKTTTVAKLARQQMEAGHKVHLVGADTFRAGAIEQLRIWSERLNCGFTGGREGGDPAAAAYEGVLQARGAGANLVLVDTSGRLHNKDNLMRELEKVKRVLGKQDPVLPQETLLVLDATNGSNALSQATEFKKGVGVSGIIITKLDSSAKGGVVAAVKHDLGLDTLYVGVGEQQADLIPFDRKGYVARFFGGEEKPEETPVQEKVVEEPLTEAPKKSKGWFGWKW